jgi:hypothetical protein
VSTGFSWLWQLKASLQSFGMACNIGCGDSRDLCMSKHSRQHTKAAWFNASMLPLCCMDFLIFVRFALELVAAAAAAAAHAEYKSGLLMSPLVLLQTWAML